MTGRMDRETGLDHGRGRHPGDQARWARLLPLLLCTACGAGQGPESVGPLWGRITGPAYEGREAPPGADAAFPNLGTIPPRPTVADPAVRDALTAALAAERERSRNPLDAERRPELMRPAGTAGDRSMPMRAPAPAALTAVPRIPWEEDAPAAPRPAAQAAPTPPAAAPSAAPAMPQMEAAPPPPPPADLLAPGAAPPAPPPAELLAPPAR